MKSTPDPTEIPVILGAPVRETKPTPPDPAKPFETVDFTPPGLAIDDDPAPVYIESTGYVGFTAAEAQALATAVSACTLSAEELAGIADADSVAPAK